MSVLMNGKKIALEMKQKMRAYLDGQSSEVFFDIVYVGNDPVIDNFLKYKEQFARDIGVRVRVHRFPENITQLELENHVKAINDAAQSLIIQLPLPEHINAQTVLNLVSPEKDVDVLSERAQNLFKSGDTELLPAVAGSIIKFLTYYNIPLRDKNIVVIGNGSLVGKPIKLWLERESCTYSSISKKTNEIDKKNALKLADIIISGAGHSYVVCPEDITSGVVLVDAGTSESGKKITGDIHPDCYKLASHYTPVPGGVGPMTIALLYQNILYAHKHYYDR